MFGGGTSRRVAGLVKLPGPRGAAWTTVAGGLRRGPPGWDGDGDPGRGPHPAAPRTEPHPHPSAHPAAGRPLDAGERNTHRPHPQPATASQRLHTPSPSINTAATFVIRLNGTLFINAFPPTIPNPATAHSARTAPRPTERGSS
ncbi:hypothetical protein Saa2_05829 [Streptomyces acidiscabies]|nr:hypothetical protein Saa2_05829 [Streptomyces acidiscabies]